jgi:glycosyltransferase involved in cell wall biosynthesis
MSRADRRLVGLYEKSIGVGQEGRVFSQGAERQEYTPGPSGLVRLFARIRWAFARHKLLRSRTFDAGWYVVTYPEVARQGWDPATHYLAIGAAQDLKPHLLFDPDWYRTKRSPVGNPLLDYIRTGAPAGVDPSPYFHSAYYIAAIGRPLRKGLSPLGDFACQPPEERVVPTPLFDRVWYLESYPDVAQSGFDPFLHYVSSGDRDARSPGPWFDAAWYRTRNVEARGAGQAPLAHYLREGTRERDPCGAFSSIWYRAQLDDSVGAGAQALLHYAWRGRDLWDSTHPTLPPPGSPVAEWSDLPWSAPFGNRPESARRVLVVVADAAAWASCDGRKLVVGLSGQPDLDVFVLSWEALGDLPEGVASLDLSRCRASRKTAVSRVLRALKFRDRSAAVVQIGRDPDVPPIIEELKISAAVLVPGNAGSPNAIPAVMAKMPPHVIRHDVSAIVPCYNHARYLDERIGSILGQRVLPSEIIALDDGSTDDSLAALERWQRNSPVPFKIVRNQRNSGSPFGQWAKGVSLARSELVWIAESDDSSSPHFLERVLPYFADHRVALAYAESRVIGAQGEWLADSYRFYTDSLNSRKWLTGYLEDGDTEIDQALAIKNTIPNASAAVFRRAILLRHLPSVESFGYCGDWSAYVRCLQDGRIAYHPETLNSHRQSSGSVTDLGERGMAMLAEALGIKSMLWRSSSLSDRSRVLGLAQLLVETAVRGDRELEGPFVENVVAAWEAAAGSSGRPIDPDVFFAGLELAERLVSEAIGLETPQQREAVLASCGRVMTRLGARFRRP